MSERGGRTTGRGIRDAQLVERVRRERWPIPNALRGPLIDRLAGIVRTPQGQPEGGDIGRQGAPVMGRLRSNRPGWPDLPEAIIAGIVAMVRSSNQ